MDSPIDLKQHESSLESYLASAVMLVAIVLPALGMLMPTTVAVLALVITVSRPIPMAFTFAAARFAAFTAALLADAA